MQYKAGTKCDKSIETGRKDGALGGYNVKKSSKTLRKAADTEGKFLS